MDEIVKALVVAVVEWIPQIVGAAASLLVVWIGKARMLASAVAVAAVDAEDKVNGPKMGGHRRILAREAVDRTLIGKVSTTKAILKAIEGPGMRAVQRASKPPGKP